MSEPTTYRIRTVMDFLDVPLDRRATCLMEFAHWLSIMDISREVPGVTAGRDYYHWIDDGLSNMNVNIKVHAPQATHD